MAPLHVPRTKKGFCRVYGAFSAPPHRVWIGQAAQDPHGPIYPDTVITLRDASGNTQEILAGEPGVFFDKV